MENEIHSTAIIDKKVILGKNNKILPYTVLMGPLEIGDNNIIGPHVVIGGPGQDTRNPRYDGSESLIRIGSHNIIREFSAVHKPCYKNITSIGDNVHIMQSVHIPHDAIIEDLVTITPMCVLGGISTVQQGATLALACSIHQYSIVGAYSIVGMGAAVVKNVKPFSRYVPQKNLTVNSYAIQKYGFENFEQEISDYVLKGKSVTSAEVKGLFERYEALHSSSGRGQY